MEGGSPHRPRRPAREDALITDVSLRSCTFDNCAARRCVVGRVELTGCRTWATLLEDLVLEDRVVDGLGTTVGPGGEGKRMPCRLSGVRVSRTGGALLDDGPP